MERLVCVGTVGVSNIPRLAGHHVRGVFMTTPHPISGIGQIDAASMNRLRAWHRVDPRTLFVQSSRYEVWRDEMREVWFVAGMAMRADQVRALRPGWVVRALTFEAAIRADFDKDPW